MQPQSKEPRRKFNKDSQKAYGIIQIALGAFCFCFAVASIAFRAGLYYAGTGIWCGILMIIAGVLGVVSSKNENTDAIVGCMIMSIISCLLASTFIGMTSVACVIDAQYQYPWPPTYSSPSRPSNLPGAITVDALGIIIGFTEFFVALGQSVVCCRTTCCATRSNATHTVVATDQPYPGYQQQQQMGITVTQAV